jgi:transcriptional regulator with XRE-family HTH domain
MMDSYVVLQQRVRLGRRVRELRQKRGLTQYGLFLRTGILKHNISDIECGKHSTGVDNLIKISVALDCKLDFILCD